MALYYLSGDIGMSKKNKKSRSEKKDERKQKKTSQSKSERKSTRKKKVAKIGLAPARAAFLAVVNLNGLKVATKLARIYKAPGGEAKLREFWAKFKGDFDKLKQAIAKGSKQTIAGDEIGVAIEVAIATALPIVIALAPLIKNFKAGGDANEMKDFDQGVNDGKETLNSGDFETGYANMPEDSDLARSKKDEDGDDKGGGQASFFSPVGLIFKIGFLYAMLKANGIDLLFWLG